MNGRLIGLMLLLSVAAACSGSSSSAGPSPSAVTTSSSSAAVVKVIKAYGSTIDAALPQVTHIDARLQPCRSSVKCAQLTMVADQIAQGLLEQLSQDDQLRESTTSGELAPGVSPVVILSEQDARDVRRVAVPTDRTNRETTAALRQLVKEVGKLKAELEKWSNVKVPTS